VREPRGETPGAVAPGIVRQGAVLVAREAGVPHPLYRNPTLATTHPPPPTSCSFDPQPGPFFLFWFALLSVCAYVQGLGLFFTALGGKQGA
jgi:hypothetical protein